MSVALDQKFNLKWMMRIFLMLLANVCLWWKSFSQVFLSLSHASILSVLSFFLSRFSKFVCALLSFYKTVFFTAGWEIAPNAVDEQFCLCKSRENFTRKICCWSRNFQCQGSRKYDEVKSSLAEKVILSLC